MVGSLIWSLIAAICVLQVAVFGTTIYLHRTATHRAMTLHPVISWAFRLGLWLSTGIITKEFVAVHRKHHAFTESVGDPHSPYLEGFWKVQLGSVFYYMRESNNKETIATFAKDIQDDAWDRHLFRHGVAGPLIGLLLLCLLLGPGWGLLAAVLHALVYLFVLTSSINGLCHRVGYKNFDNTATNIRFLALLSGGEGLHNNHHAFPRSPKLSFKASEIDPAWPIIKCLTLFGLARVQRTINETGS